MLVCGRDQQFVMLYELLIGALEHVGVTVGGPPGTTPLTAKASAEAEKLEGGQAWIQPALLLLDMIAQPLLVDKTTLQSSMGELERNTMFASHSHIFVPPDLPNVRRPSDTPTSSENAADKTKADQPIAADNYFEGK